MNWKAWYDSFDIYATAAGVNNKPEKVQCCIFLHVAGAEAQKVFRTIEMAPEDKDKLRPLVEAFREYCEGKTNLTVIRYQFHSFNQTTENMDEYIRELQSRITYCDYGPVEKSILCDKLICGIKSDKLRDRLLQTPNLALSECMAMCRLSEHRAAHLNKNKATEIEDQVDAVTKRPTNTRTPITSRAPGSMRRSTEQTWATSKFQCKKCAYTHQRGACPAFGKQCTNCKRIGHFYKVCTRSKAQNTPVNEVSTDPNNEPPEWSREAATIDDLFVGSMADVDNNSVNSVKMCQPTTCVPMARYELFVGSIADGSTESANLWYANLSLGDTSVRFKLDTGSEANIIPLGVFNKLQGRTLKPSTCHLVTFSGQRIKPEGEAVIVINGRRLQFQITTGGSPIIGKNGCVQLQLVKRVAELVQCTDIDNTEANKLVNDYSDIFTGLGTIKVDAKIHIDNAINPTIDPPRRIPHAIIDKVKKELDKMISLGVIVEQIEPTPWVSSITIVKKPNKIRICLDPTKLNRAIKRGQYPTKTIEEVVANTSGAKYFSVIDANCGYWQIELDTESSKLCTFNTPWGRYRYTRLPFGIKTAGDIFINEMDKILYGLPGVNVITDDINIRSICRRA